MDFLALQARLRPQKTAIIDISGQKSLNYAQTHQAVNQLVARLVAMNAQPGDRIGCISYNRVEVVLLHLACARAGLIFVPLNWRLAKEELQHLLDDCQPALLFADDSAMGFGFNALPIAQLAVSESILGAEHNSPEHSPVNSSEQRIEIADCPQFNSAAPSLILYTSGTTGRPKGIMHSEDTLMETTLNMMLLGQVNENSVFLCEAPMFHVIGLISCVRPALLCGGQLVITDGFKPERTLSVLQNSHYAITHYFCVPQMANTLRQHSDYSATSLKSLKALLTGGAPHPEVQIKAWLDDGIPIVDGYGMSEAGTVLGMPFDLTLIAQNAGYVGTHTHRLQVRLADANDQPIGNGSAGELQVKGNNLCLGIWQQPELFKACFTRDGWFRTGDIAIQNSQGFYRIVDRQKDMYISGGENVYPGEIESAVLQLPQVKECAVIGVQDQTWGEVGCLYVTYKSGVEPLKHAQLIDILKASLAKYKLPKYIYTVDFLPRNASGKLIKSKLKTDFYQIENNS